MLVHVQVTMVKINTMATLARHEVAVVRDPLIALNSTTTILILTESTISLAVVIVEVMVAEELDEVAVVVMIAATITVTTIRVVEIVNGVDLLPVAARMDVHAVLRQEEGVTAEIELDVEVDAMRIVAAAVAIVRVAMVGAWIHAIEEAEAVIGEVFVEMFEVADVTSVAVAVVITTMRYVFEAPFFVCRKWL